MEITLGNQVNSHQVNTSTCTAICIKHILVYESRTVDIWVTKPYIHRGWARCAGAAPSRVYTTCHGGYSNDLRTLYSTDSEPAAQAQHSEVLSQSVCRSGSSNDDVHGCWRQFHAEFVDQVWSGTRLCVVCYNVGHMCVCSVVQCGTCMCVQCVCSVLQCDTCVCMQCVAVCVQCLAVWRMCACAVCWSVVHVCAWAFTCARVQCVSVWNMRTLKYAWTHAFDAKLFVKIDL